MAVLYYSQSLTLDLREATERKRNGESYEMGASTSVPVSKEFYETIFTQLKKIKPLRRALRSVTSERMESLWKTLYDLRLSGVHIPQGRIRVTPCVHHVNDESIYITIPFYIEGATDNQVEKILKHCINDEKVICKLNEIHVEIKKVDIPI